MRAALNATAHVLPLAAKDGRANLLRAFKANGCDKCGRRYPELDWSELHIDHIDPRDNQLGGAARRLSRGNPAEVIAELLKCQVLCFDCHREKTRGGCAALDGQMTLFNGSGGWRY